MINLQGIHNNKLKGKCPEKNLGEFYTYHPTVWLPWCLHTVKNLPAAQETWVQSLGQEDPLEKGMATHSSILAWRIPWPGEPDRPQSMGSQRIGEA